MGITLKIGSAPTGRKFTDPIRYFKANDPYYWEVDNIPLKQIHENVKYLQDRLDMGSVCGTFEVKRSDLSELQPYANGSDDKIRVKAGRYTSRINNALGIDNLENFVRTNLAFGAYTGYTFSTNTDFDNLVERVRSIVAVDALNLNGMSERVFGYTMKNPYEVADADDIVADYPQLKSPLLSSFNSTWAAEGAAFPLTESLSWRKFWYLFNTTTGGKVQFESETVNSEPNELISLPLLENALIKYWRGTARTAIVDVPTELEIDVPPFDEADFFYIDGNGKRWELGSNADARIDLVFIYSKPIDTSAVTIVGGGPSPTTITSPVLGIMKGAGLGLDKGGFEHLRSINSTTNTPKMLASIADQKSTTNGFLAGDNTNVAIHGSFPAPDDLLNIAPLLSEELEEDSWFLAGQTILPVAYVKVRKNPVSVNINSVGVVDPDDVVDIRPLFRTAELTYNERAGIAAATPPLSIANRAVGKYEMDHELIKYYEPLRSDIDDLKAKTLILSLPVEKHAFYESGGVKGNEFFHGVSGQETLSIIGSRSNQVIHDINNLMAIPTAHVAGFKAALLRAQSWIRTPPGTENYFGESPPLIVGHNTPGSGGLARKTTRQMMKGPLGDDRHGHAIFKWWDQGPHSWIQPVYNNPNGGVGGGTSLEFFTYLNWREPTSIETDHYQFWSLFLDGYIYDELQSITFNTS
jgi:hypothetical protein